MKPVEPARRSALRFGIFELDESSGELRRNGTLIHLAPQPFQILALLARSGGEPVDRNRIRREVWGDTAVDFDRSLNVAIAQVRAVLQDDAESPRFIQTLPRRGYRFLAAAVPVDADVCPGPPLASPSAAQSLPNRSLVALWIAGAIFLLAGLSAGGYRIWRTSAGPLRIAVLPFENLQLDEAGAAQADGLFDDLLTRLGGVQPDRIQVIGRRSVLYWKAHGAGGLREIGERLNVGYAIEGSVRRDDDDVTRVTVRLVRTASEAVLWSATFIQDASPRMLEEALVAKVSSAVLTNLVPGALPRAPETACGDGWEAFETGRLLAHRGGIADLEKSLQFFREASCAPARAALAQTLVTLARIGPHRDDSWETARTEAQRALDGNVSAAAHLALGNIAFWHDWNWTMARREFAEALRINPGDPDGRHDLAWLETALGLRADALASLDMAIALDPLSARTRIDSAWLLLQIGYFNRAAAEARRTLDLDPGMNEARACLSRALLYAGDARGAIDAIRPMLSRRVAGELTNVPAERAARLVIELPLREEAKLDPYKRAWRLTWLGSRQDALTALEAAFSQRSLMMPLAAVDPAFAAIRNEPRYRKIIAAMGLV